MWMLLKIFFVTTLTHSSLCACWIATFPVICTLTLLNRLETINLCVDSQFRLMTGKTQFVLRVLLSMKALITEIIFPNPYGMTRTIGITTCCCGLTISKMTPIGTCLFCLKTEGTQFVPWILLFLQTVVALTALLDPRQMARAITMSISHYGAIRILARRHNVSVS